MSSIEVKKVPYAGWPNCYLLTDGEVEVIATTDIGPRIIRCGFVNEPNLFAEFPDQVGKTGGDEWRIYGGHRLWHSPETKGRCYHPDNFPVDVNLLPNGFHLKQPMEPNTLIEKEIVVTLDPSTRRFTVTHHLTNRGNWPVTFAPWAISVMKAGGVGIVPQYRTPDEEGLLPNRYMALWPYTEMNDSRVAWGSRYILLTQDPQKTNPFKFGLSVPEGWAAYAVDGYLFLKEFEFDPAQNYPDNGVNVEFYTNHLFAEVESLGPLQTMEPGATATHTEKWTLFRNPGMVRTEKDVERSVAPLVQK